MWSDSQVGWLGSRHTLSSEENKLTLHEDGVVHVVMWADVPQRVAELLVTTTPNNRWLITDIVLNHWLSCLTVCDHLVVQECTVRPIQHVTIYISTVLYTHSTTKCRASSRQ